MGRPPSTGITGQMNESRGAWLVGSLTLPNATSSDESVELIVWMTQDGFLLSATPSVRVDSVTQLEDLAKTVETRQDGGAGMPTSIRTASEEFAEWLRGHLSDRVTVILADTPEFEGVSQTLNDFSSLPAESEGRPTYLTTNIEQQHVARFFECAAGLYRAQPWRIVRSDTDVICVRVPSIQIENSAAIVIGQNRQCYGALVFPNYEAYLAYVKLAKAHTNGVGSPAKVEFISLNFERAQDLEPSLLVEVKRFGWKLAGPTAYPWPIAVGENWATRTVSLRELTLLSCLSDALPRFLTETRQFQTSCVTRTSFKASYRIDFPNQPIDIELEFPHPAESGDDAA